MRFISNIKKNRTASARMLVLAIALVLVLGCTIAGTLMFLVDKTGDVKNTFTAANVTTEITEEFDGVTKKNVNIINNGDIPVYVRVNLITYRVNESGDKIGGTATIPNFNRGEGWFKGSDGFYYYAGKVQPGKAPVAPLIGETGINLISSYSDADGGKQVIEVMGEAIQADPAVAVEEAWPAVEVDTSSGMLTEKQNQ